MRKNAILLACWCFALGLVSCQKDEVLKTCTGFQGEWIWVESIGGISGETLTPENTGQSRRLEIDDLYYREWVNGELVWESEYDLEISNIPLLGTKDSLYLELEGRSGMAVILEDSELELIEQCFDCYLHRYRRK